VKNILDGLSKAVRYTRKDDPAKAYQFQSALEVVKEGKGTLSFLLEEVRKIIVLRKDPKTGKVSVTPLDRQMIGNTYVTKDGEPLGDRGMVDMSVIIRRAQAIEAMQRADMKPGNVISTILHKGRGFRTASDGLPPMP
jgi:hypothetical protein